MDTEYGLSAPVPLREPPAAPALAALHIGVTAGTERRALGRILGYLVVTRLTLYIVAACAIRLLPAAVQPPADAYLGKSPTLAALVRWDAWWYLNIVERGYWLDAPHPSNVAFFPVFPLLVRGLAALTGNPLVAGLLVANAAAVAGVVGFWLWVREVAGAAAAERSVRWLLVFPFSFFFHTIYAESLFLALVAFGFLAARRGHWAWAGVLGGLASASRPLGVLLFPAFAWALWEARRAGRAVRVRDLLSVLLVPAGLGAYAAYLWAAFGTPFASWDAHAAGWSVRFQWDLVGYWREARLMLSHGPRAHSYTHLLDSLRIILPLCFIALTVGVFRRLGTGPGLFTAGAVTVAILFAPESLGREFLAAVPAFAVAGIVDRGGGTGEGLRLLSFGLLLVLLVAFATAHFVG